MIPRNYIIPLLAFGLYSQANNLNLSNNTTIMIIILALIVEQKEIQTIAKAEVAHVISSNDTSAQNGNQCGCVNSQNTQGYVPYTQPVIPVYVTTPQYTPQVVVPTSGSCYQEYCSPVNQCGCQSIYPAFINSGYACPELFTTQAQNRYICPELYTTQTRNRCGCASIYSTQNSGSRCGCGCSGIQAASSRCGCGCSGIQAASSRCACGCANLLY